MTQCYYETENIPLAKALRECWEQIRDEAEELFRRENDPSKVNAPMEGQNGRNMSSVGVPKYVGKNASIHLQVVNDLLDPPEAKVALTPAGHARRARRKELCPVTMGALQQWMPWVGNIGFNKLFPGGNISPHYGVLTSNQYVRLHIGLRTDPGARFCGKGVDPYTWKDGETMAFDDATLLHWVEHHGEHPRLILSVDVKKEILELVPL